MAVSPPPLGTDGESVRPYPVLTFLGAAGTVTGSRFLVETARSTVLVDCGLFQGFKQLRLRNWQPFLVDPSTIDAVVLTHAHVDHVGYIPRLCKLGFSGPVYCSQGTADLASIVLPDSGHLHEEEAAYANRMGFSKHRPAEALYTEIDARASLERLRAIPLDESIPISPGVDLTLRPAGHILGSCMVHLDFEGSDRSVLCSGDLGRRNHPLLIPPAPPHGATVVVMESTYGGREHDDTGAMKRLSAAITRTAERGGTVVIPAFAVDRTEVVLFRLRQLMGSGRFRNSRSTSTVRWRCGR